VLAIGCANVANLRLARATARASEWAVRISLGASRGQLTRLLLIEAAVLTTLALFSSWVGVRGLIGWLGPRYLTPTVTVDLRVALFSALVAAAVVLLSGLAPAWFVMRRATARGLRESGVAPNAWLRNTLVVIQITACLVLLAIGSLLMRSVQVSASTKVERLDRLLVAQLNFDFQGYDAPRAAKFLDALLERLRADSRFSGAGLSSNCVADTRPSGNAGQPWTRTDCLEVTPGYFDALAFSPLVGRTFNPAESGNVVVLNESAARKLAPTGSPVGMAVLVRNYSHPDTPVVHDVIGVVPDSYRTPKNLQEAVAMVYTPLRQPMPLYLSLVARERDTVDLAAALRRTIAAIDPVGPATRVNRASEAQAERSNAQRHLAAAFGAIGAAALALAATGLFAVMAYAVSMRTREIGIRMALGAHPAVVQRLVLGQSLRLAGIGAAIGLAIAIPIAHAFRGAILGISPLDPVAVGFVTMLLVVTALVAGAVPARRAAAVDPVKALRAD
jgi:predicted permease